MAVSLIVLDRQCAARVFPFGTTSASEQALVTINNGTAALSNVVLDVKGSQNIAGDLNLTGTLNITGAINTTTVTNTNVTDLTITVNDGGSTPTDDTAGIQVEGTGNTVVGGLFYRAASATSWSVGTGVSQQDIVGLTAIQTLTNKTLTSPTLTTPVLGVATGTSLVLSGKLDEAKFADLPSASTTNIGVAAGTYGNITGSTSITAFDTVQAGVRRVVTFTGILTLTHNATSLILPTAANITTAAGDCATFISLGSGNWICTQYQRATGLALATASSAYFRRTVVSGTQDSVNKVFTIANTVAAGSEHVWINGQLLNDGGSNDYIYNGTTTITFQAGFTAPSATDVIKVSGHY
jgi:hypothetical protein